MAPLLQVQDLEVRFYTKDGEVQAVNGISYSMEQGDTLGLVGESGCGKSVSTMAILRLIPEPPGKITGGQVLFDLDREYGRIQQAGYPDLRICGIAVDLSGKEIDLAGIIIEKDFVNNTIIVYFKNSLPTLEGHGIHCSNRSYFCKLMRRCMYT